MKCLEYNTKLTKSEIRQKIRWLKKEFFGLLWDNTDNEIFYKCLMSDYLKKSYTKRDLITFLNVLLIDIKLKTNWSI